MCGEVQEAFLDEVRPHRVGRENAGRERPSVTEPTRERETLPFPEAAITVACFSAPGACWGSCRPFRQHSQEAIWAGRSSHRCLMEISGTPPAWGWGRSGVGLGHGPAAAQVRFNLALNTAVTGTWVHQARGPPGPASCPQLPPSLVAERI